MKKWIGNQLYNPVFIGLFLFLVALIVLGIFDMKRNGGADWDGILTEAHGMLMDVLIFGVLLTLFEQVRSKKNQIKNYHDQLKDFRKWASEEGVLRKVGILERLNEMGAPLPLLAAFEFPKAKFLEVNLRRAILTGTNLSGADIASVDLEGADLFGARLNEAILMRVNFNDANLEMTNLNNADLRRVQNLTCEQIQSANIDRKTRFPDYIKITWADDDTYTCEMVERDKEASGGSFIPDPN